MTASDHADMTLSWATSDFLHGPCTTMAARPPPPLTMAPTVFMFSGQGSQSYQMGRELFDHDPVFAKHMRAMDEQVRALSGLCVLQALYGAHQRHEWFDDIRLTHPAIFMVEYALAQVLIERGIRPELTLGVSLGSVAAATVAGHWALEDALRQVVAHADWLASHAEPGAMLAVLAGAEWHAHSPLRELTVVAADNGPQHMVLSMRHEVLDEVQAWLRSQGLAFGRLPVRYAFHSPWMHAPGVAPPALPPSPAGAPGGLPMVCCAHADVLTQLPANYLAQVARAPIEWATTLAYLEGRGPWRYLDLGPSATLATLLKHQLPGTSASTAQPLMNRHGRDLALLAALA